MKLLPTFNSHTNVEQQIEDFSKFQDEHSRKTNYLTHFNEVGKRT